MLRDQEAAAADADSSERVRAKGTASRQRTIQVDAETDQLAIPEKGAERGRVLAVQGLSCLVVTEKGESRRCYVRRLLKSLASDQRTVVVTGDWVWIRPEGADEGLVLRVEARRGTLERIYRGREHTIAANVDQILIVASVLDPELKPNLIDRYLAAAEESKVGAIVCLNKLDRTGPDLLEPLMDSYRSIGYPVVGTSAMTGAGLDVLRQLLSAKETVVVGQSGVGKSTLLNSLEPSFQLKVRAISAATGKGRHTTTTARLLALSAGGTVIDTPGIRQFELRANTPKRLAPLFREFRPLLGQCRFPDCAHVAEEDCAIKQAVAEGAIDAGRYESYLRILDVRAAVAQPDGEDEP